MRSNKGKQRRVLIGALLFISIFTYLMMRIHDRLVEDSKNAIIHVIHDGKVHVAKKIIDKGVMDSLYLKKQNWILTYKID